MLDLQFMELFWLFGSCILLNVSLTAVIVRRLKTNHPRVWEAIGSPGYFRPRRVGDFRVLRFILKLDFIKTRDALLIALGILALISLCCCIVLFTWVWLLAGHR
jgi:hypothetical protein